MQERNEFFEETRNVRVIVDMAADKLFTMSIIAGAGFSIGVLIVASFVRLVFMRG